MTLKWLRLCALMLASSGLFLAAVGCGQCPLLEFDSDGDGMVSSAEFLAADPARLAAVQAQINADPATLLLCSGFVGQLP